MSADTGVPARAGGPTPLEQARLARLRSYGILDSEPEQLYDDIARLAARIRGTPIAAVSFVDEGRQWFKAEVGLGVAETSRDVSFCAQAILAPGQMLVVPDATADARFAVNPLVTGDPGIASTPALPWSPGTARRWAAAAPSTSSRGCSTRGSSRPSRP